MSGFQASHFSWIMQRTRSRGPFVLFGGAACALLIGLTCAPTNARAGCSGHSLFTGRQALHFDAVLSAALHAQVVTAVESVAPSDLPKPCNGPECSRRDAPAPYVPISFVEARVDHWGLYSSWSSTRDDQVALAAVVSHPVRPIHRSTRLDRPPRLLHSFDR